MKYLIGLIVVILIFVLGYQLFVEDSPALDTDKITNYPPKDEGPIVVFGDSLVSGVGADTEGGFVTMLSKMINEPILNYGWGGDTTEAALGRVDEVLSENPKIVLILLGGNDYLDRKPKEETFGNLEDIISRFQETGAVTVLLGIRGGLLQDTYKDDFEELAEETGSVFVPNVLDGITGKSDYMYDAIHPNEKGYRVIADKIFLTLNPLISS